MDIQLSGGDGQVAGDSWSLWEPEPERAFRDHDAALEPYASMSREEILECMRHARGGKEWEFLREFYVDKCDEDERQYDRFMFTLKSYLEYGEEECWLVEAAGPATRLRGEPGGAPGPGA